MSDHEKSKGKLPVDDGYLKHVPKPCGMAMSMINYSTGKTVWWYPEKGDDNNSGMSKESPVRTSEKAESLLS